MSKKKENTSFESLTDWLKQNENLHAVSRGKEKILKKEDISNHIKTTEMMGGESHSPKSPTIDLIKDGDVVSGIRVTCVCGETISIDLEYNQETNSLVYKQEQEL